jgi:hypothetical protein
MVRVILSYLGIVAVVATLQAAGYWGVYWVRKLIEK